VSQLALSGNNELPRARLQIRIRIRVKSWMRNCIKGSVDQWSQIRITLIRSRIRTRISVKSRIRISMKVKRWIRIYSTLKCADPHLNFISELVVGKPVQNTYFLLKLLQIWRVFKNVISFSRCIFFFKN
jgi:hypothetical protein